MTDAAFEQAWTQGRSLDTPGAVRDARQETTSRPGRTPDGLAVS
jgi:hypothetical protein